MEYFLYYILANGIILFLDRKDFQTALDYIFVDAVSKGEIKFTNRKIYNFGMVTLALLCMIPIWVVILIWKLVK